MKNTILAVHTLLLLVLLTACGDKTDVSDSNTTSTPEKPAASAKDTRPNVVLYVSDDHGLDAFSAYGASAISTPNLDALAGAGIRFTYAYASSASCAVSRSALMSGLHGHHNGMFGHMHDYNHFSSYDKVRSLPVLLSEAGYRTARIGKFHLAPEHVYKFDTVLSKGKANDMKSIGRSPKEMAEATKEFINSDPNQPFFILMASDDPHRGNPFEIGDKPNAFGNLADSYPGITKKTFKPEDVDVPSFLPDIPETREEIAQYYEAVDRLDQGIGHMVDLLKKVGAWENTIFIYLSDNGVAMPGAKTTHYEPGIRLPLVVRMPENKAAGFVQDAMVSWVDITPTILEWADASPDDYEFDGRSFAKIIDQNEKQNWDEIFASHNFHELTMYYPMRTLRTRDYKLIWNLAHELRFPFATDLVAASTWRGTIQRKLKTFGKRSIDDFLYRAEFELFDMNADPDEANNLADDPKYAEIKEQMINKIRQYQVSTMDPWIVESDPFDLSQEVDPFDIEQYK